MGVPSLSRTHFFVPFFKLVEKMMTHHSMTSQQFLKKALLSGSELINLHPAHTTPATDAAENCLEENGINPEDKLNLSEINGVMTVFMH